MRVKKIAAIVGFIAIVVLTVVFVSAALFYRSYEAKQERIRAQQQPVEREWQERLTQFRKEIRPGTPRAEVKVYLDAQKMLYVDGRDIFVKLGEEPGDGFACDRWTGYANFEFAHDNAAETGPRMS